jgi:hypothetical protein
MLLDELLENKRDPPPQDDARIGLGPAAEESAALASCVSVEPDGGADEEPDPCVFQATMYFFRKRIKYRS